MQLSAIIKNLGLREDFIGVFEKNWIDSEKSFPAELPDFLNPEKYHENLEFVGIDKKFNPLIDEVSAKISNNQAFCHLAWHCYKKLYHYENPSFHQWPLFENILGKNGGIFYLLIASGMVPLVKIRFQSMNIPEQIAVDTCNVLKDNCEAYKILNNSPGVNVRTIYWIRHYTDGEIFRIGRFEYMLCKRDIINIEIYKNRQTGKILALAGDGTYFNHEGFVLYPDEDKTKTAFISRLIREGNSVKGIPVDSVTGTAINTQVKLNLHEWEKKFSPDDMILDLHIPGGGKMTLNACNESFNKALDFYKKYFPEVKISAIMSTSWIFYSYYEKVLPESNLAGFMKELYLFPFPSCGKDGISFIFGKDEGDINSYPQDNTIRKVMVDVFKAGNRLRRGGMFFLPEHIGQFGQQIYRTKFKTDITNLTV